MGVVGLQWVTIMGRCTKKFENHWVRSRTVLLTLTIDNSNPKNRSRVTGKCQSRFRQSLCSYMYMESTFVAEATSQKQKNE